MIKSSDMSLEFILDPPEKKSKNQSSFTIFHRIPTFITIEISNLSIEFYFPQINTTTIASTKQMTMNTSLSINDLQGLLIAITFQSNQIEIYKNNLLTLQYIGENTNINVDLNIPTMTLMVTMKLISQDIVTIQIQQFLEFFTNFQRVEDNSIELKMAYGYYTGGKMKHLIVDMDEIIICLQDHRNPIQNIMKMQVVHVELKTTRLTEPILIDQQQQQANLVEDGLIWVDQYEGCNFEKMIYAKFDTMKFIGQKNCYVNNVTVKIMKHIKNCDNYLDHETIEGSVETVNFEYIDNLFLDWLVTLQNVADSIPSSRFGHTKSSNIHGNVQHINISVAPHDEIAHQHLKKKINELSATQLDFNNWNPVTHLFLYHLNQQYVRFIFQNLDVTKVEEAYAVSSDVTLTFQLLDIITNLRYNNLTENYLIQLDQQYNDYNLSTNDDVQIFLENSSALAGFEPTTSMVPMVCYQFRYPGLDALKNL